MTLKFVTKADGRKEPFEKRKILDTCQRAGLDKKTCEEIANRVEVALEDGSTTHSVYRFVMEEVEKSSTKSASLFGLREGISDLDSESFELFTFRVLKAHGYECEWNRVIEGASVEHQVDVIAKQNDKTFLVECKRHFNAHRFTGLDIALQNQARLEDLMDGYKQKKHKYNFCCAWIFTNTKLSEHAIRYAEAKNIRTTGWRSGNFRLENLVESKRIFPITILKIDLMSKAKLLKERIITIQDVVEYKKKIDIAVWPSIVKQSKDLLK